MALPSLNVDYLSRLACGDDSETVILAKNASPVPERPAAPGSFINSVNLAADEERGPQLSRDVYLGLDNASADDLLVEKSMLVKWLITRYEKSTIMHKPRDLMFALLECICTGLEIYLCTQQGDCRYIDRAEIFDGDIFCSCSEWILGIVEENETEIETNAPEPVIEKDLDSINLFGDNGDGNSRIDDIIKFSDCVRTNSSGLPHLLQCYNDENMMDDDDEASNDRLQQNSERAREAKRRKIETDAQKLKKYINLNVNVLVDKSMNAEELQEGRKANCQRRRENVLKLIVDMKELERLLTFLLYVDREALYGDIDVAFRNKLGTSRPFCLFKNGKLSKDVEENCLINSDGNRLRDAYKNITDGRVDPTPEETASSVGAGTTMSDRVMEIFEVVTFLFLDKISTVVVESLFTNSVPTKHAYKFGLVDVMYPRVGKISCHKFQTDMTIAPLSRRKAFETDGDYGDPRRRTGISFTDR